MLINAAGLGDSGRFDRAEPEKIAAMLQVNVVALTELTRLVLPQMVARRRGKVMLVGLDGGVSSPDRKWRSTTRAKPTC